MLARALRTSRQRRAARRRGGGGLSSGWHTTNRTPDTPSRLLNACRWNLLCQLCSPPSNLARIHDCHRYLAKTQLRSSHLERKACEPAQQCHLHSSPDVRANQFVFAAARRAQTPQARKSRAHKYEFYELFQADLGRPVPSTNIFRLARRANHSYKFPRLTRERGVGHRHERWVGCGGRGSVSRATFRRAGFP